MPNHLLSFIGIHLKVNHDASQARTENTILSQSIGTFPFCRCDDRFSIFKRSLLLRFSLCSFSLLQKVFVKDESFGEYVCNAFNELGNWTRIIDLRKGTKPAQPTHIVTKGNNSDSFVFDIGAPPQDPDAGLMSIIGFRLQVLPKKAHGKNESVWMNARVIDRDFTDGEEPETYVFFHSFTFRLSFQA